MNPRAYFTIATIGMVILSAGILLISNSNEEEVKKPVGGLDRPYYFQIVLSQWTMKIIDLNSIEDLMLSGSSRSNSFALSTYTEYMGKLEKGSKVFFQIYSLDVQHGISINELDISITILEPTEDIDATIPYFYDFYLPEKDVTIFAYCQVYCGLGHSNMKLRIDIGTGETQYGTTLFNFGIILNVIIAVTFLYFITAPIKRKMLLVQQKHDSSNIPTFKAKLFNLYDISKLSEKQLVAIRQGYLDIAKVAVFIQNISAKSFENAKSTALSLKNTKLWSLVEL